MLAVFKASLGNGRSQPNQASPPSTAFSLTYGQLLATTGFDMSNGFVEVYCPPWRPDSVCFWVRTVHLVFPGPMGGAFWTPLTDEVWFREPRTFRPQTFSICVKVSHGADQLDELDSARLTQFLKRYAALIGDETATPTACAALLPLGSCGDTYVYVALMVGAPVALDGYSPRHHVTLAYLPLGVDAGGIHRALTRTLNLWIAISPPSRAQELVGARSRAVYRRRDSSPGFPDLADRDGLLSLAPDQFERDLQEGALQLVASRYDSHDEPQEYAADARRIYKRDVARLQEAQARSGNLPPLPTEGIEVLPGAGLGHPTTGLHMVDLLSYLEDTIRHFPGTQRIFGSARVSPYVLSRHAWHISRQQDWTLDIASVRHAGS